jgi:hypothetical protein
MQTSYLAIEHLHLAAQQLNKLEPTYTRFALILIDNLVELLFFRKTEHLIDFDDGIWIGPWRRGGAGNISEEQRNKFRGKNGLSERRSFCVNLGLLSQVESEFISRMHKYRNGAYHGGVLHDEYLRPITWHYHDVACDLLGRICPIEGGYLIGEKVTAIVRRYTSKLDPQKAISEKTDNVVQKLKRAKKALNESVQTVLSHAAVEFVERMEGEIAYIAEQAYHDDEVAALEDVQFSCYVEWNNDLQSKLSTIQKYAVQQKLIAKEREIWKPKYQLNQLAYWKSKAENLSMEQNPLKALKKFSEQIEDYEKLDKMLRHVATIISAQEDINEARSTGN